MPLIFRSQPLGAQGPPPAQGSRLSRVLLTGGARHRALQPRLGLTKSPKCRAGNAWAVFPV